MLPSSLGGLEPPSFRLTAERANQLRHRDWRRTILWSAEAKYQRCACHTYPALANSGQEMGWKLRDRWEVKESRKISPTWGSDPRP